MGKNILSVLDLRDELNALIDDSIDMKGGKSSKKSGKRKTLSNKNIALLFEKPSLRTKASFTVAIEQLKGNAVYMGPDEVQIGKRESPSDAGKVLSRYFDAIVYRAFSHDTVVEVAEAATVPVLNALDDLEHPCQAVSDLMTVKEKKGVLKDLKLSYVGDGNNVCNSLLLGCAITGMNISVASPSNYGPDSDIVSQAKQIAEESGNVISIMTNPFEAINDADIVYTDVWVSMGLEADRDSRENAFLPYQVTPKLMSKAKSDAIFMHCLPAHRGLEVLPEVIDGERSVVFDQAENRLHAQKAILLSSLS